MSERRDGMALPRLSDFYANLFSRSWLLFLLSEIIVIAIVVTVFGFIVGRVNPESAFMITIIALILIQSFVSYMLLRYTLKPTEIIMRALIQVSGEPSTQSPPDRKDPSFKKDGLDHVLDIIYAREHIAPSETRHPADDFRIKILETLPIGMIALDRDNRVIAKNSRAPVTVDENHVTEIQLDFSTVGDSLSEWLAQVAGNQISAEKVWTRIPNVAPGNTTERRIFDVIAHYKKDAPTGIETILITVDRTAEYADEEANLDFIALAAHELRGPVTVIRGYLDILDEQLVGQLSGEQHQLIDRLNVSAKRLASYISNILNASRYDRKHLQLTLKETSLASIIDDIKDDLELRARTLNRQIVWQIPANLPTVAADQSSIDEVISNLMDNAIKYSHDGGNIEVGAAIDDKFVAISVRDHGIGIPENVASGLFSKFYRSHRSRDAISGTGLGLYISRAIVESHGGNIEVESREGEGSLFTFTLPIYASVSDKLAGDNSNAQLINDTSQNGWINNHSRVKK